MIPFIKLITELFLDLFIFLAFPYHSIIPFFKKAIEVDPTIEQFWLSYINALINEKQLKDATQVIANAKNMGLTTAKLNK